MKKANELLEQGHQQKYPSKQNVPLRPTDNVRKNSQSFVSKMNNLQTEMYGRSEPQDYVVVDRRNLRPLMMNYSDGFYEKWQTKSDAQESADDLNSAYQKTYGAVEGPHVVMYKSDFFEAKRNKLQEEVINEEPEKDTYWMITKANRENLIKLGGVAEEIGRSATNNFQKYCK